MQIAAPFNPDASSLDMDHSMFTKPGAGDDKLFIQFRNHYVPDVENSEAEGRPIFRDCPFIRIITPGDRDNVVDRPVRPEDKMRFPRQWAQYQNGESEIGNGTRLEEWPLISRGIVEELRYFGFRTVEHLAGASDDKIGRFPGLRQLQSTAKGWLQAATEAAPVARLEAELAKKDTALAVMQEQINELLTRLPKDKKVKDEA